MKIGYSLEGRTDRALIQGLQERLCPGAELIEGRSRGIGAYPRREIPNVCKELRHKGVDLIVFLRDANEEDWRDVQRGDEDKCPPEHGYMTVFGVCDRNVECWLAADAQWLASQTGCDANLFRVDDPKDAVEQALRINHRDGQEQPIIDLVKRAPLRKWFEKPSFEHFYDKLRDQSRRLGCQLPNLLDGD